MEKCDDAILNSVVLSQAINKQWLTTASVPALKGAPQSQILSSFSHLWHSMACSPSHQHVLLPCKLWKLLNIKAHSVKLIARFHHTCTFNSSLGCYICLLSHAAVKWRCLKWIHFPSKAIINSQEMGNSKKGVPAWDFTADFHRASLFLPIRASQRLQLRPWMEMISSTLRTPPSVYESQRSETDFICCVSGLLGWILCFF